MTGATGVVPGFAADSELSQHRDGRVYRQDGFDSQSSGVSRAAPDAQPDGKLFVTDTQLEAFGGKRGEWGVAVCDAAGTDWTWIAKFQGDEGATTWRKKPPTSCIQPDGKRIYYNVNSGPWTTLHVAEREA